jgi:hypothetical protein
MQPYQPHNNQIGVRWTYVVELGLAPSYEALKMKFWRSEKKGKPLRLKEGRGEGNEMLLNWNYLPSEWKEILTQKYGNPEKTYNALERYFALDAKARHFYESFRFQDGTALKPEQISKYTINASVLNALELLRKDRQAIHKAKGNPGSSKILWPSIMSDLKGFNNHLLTTYGVEHTLKPGERLKEKLRLFLREGYELLIDGRNKLNNAAKVKEDKQEVLIEELLKKHTNLDNAQVATLYNHVADKLAWKKITPATIANWREKLGLYTYAGRRGATNFRNNKAMQVKRKAPSVSMAYWTLDGWDVELLYQANTTNAKGHQVTTYHNRPTVVVVLDRVAALNYPIGYAVGTHETPELIKQALRNAANHTRELFGERFKPLQLQSDRYGKGTLTPLYEAVTGIYTPARAHNSKAKAIEPYFLTLNKDCQLYFPSNWSGFGLKANEDSQPNEEYLNKVRHSFPDYAGVCKQVDRLIEMKRAEVRDEYLARWDKLPTEKRLPLTTEEYLNLFGETHSHTNRIHHDGFNPTIMGVKRYFDCFDIRFRELSYIDWAVKYDPENLDQVLVLNAEINNKVTNIIGTHRFLLEAKHIQPEALYDRQEGDSTQLARINAYNKRLEAQIIERNIRNRELLENEVLNLPELKDTLAKLILTDSKGQHKDQRNAARALPNKPAQLPESNDGWEIIEDDIRDNY